MLASITDAVRNGNIYDIEELIQSNLKSGIKAREVLDAMITGLDQCGNKFESGEYYLPELIMAGDAFKKGVNILEPHLEQTSMEQAGKIILGTVVGDVHDIGKNLVGFLLKCSGFEVIDLGTDIQAEGFVKAVEKYKPDVLGMSALLTTTMLGMEDVIKALEKSNLRKNIKVIIGGGPVSERFAEQIGADAYASDAVAGVRKIKDWF